MICAVFERRPKSTRNITDPRAAKPVGQIEFEDQRNHQKNIDTIKATLEERGFNACTSPSATTNPEFQFVVYVYPKAVQSPKELATKKKPVSVGGTTGLKRRLPIKKKR